MDDYSLEHKIGQMIMVGFRGSKADGSLSITRMIRTGHIGGVWLTDHNEQNGAGIGNIESPAQVAYLTAFLRQQAGIPLFIAIDAEGGQIIRLKEQYGFPKTYSARYLGERNDPAFTYQASLKIAALLKELNINFNFSPVVDLDRNPENPALGKKDRCFSADPDRVIRHAGAVIRAGREYGILTCLKHFPGQGSASADSHRDITDVTASWSETELEPYRFFIERRLTDAVLTGHIMLRQFDDALPATLSKKIITGLLRDTLHYDGLVISDDFDMGAIHAYFSHEQAVELAIAAGVDVILHSNVDHYRESIAEMTFNTILNLVRGKKISEDRIDRSFRRIMALKSCLK